MTVEVADMSSDDSNIATFFQTFDKDNFHLSPTKDLSQTFARIELTIKEEFDFGKPEKVSEALNTLYNLILFLINSVCEFSFKLQTDFVEYYEKRISAIFTRIFTPELFHKMYNLDSEHIDLIWQVHRLIELLFNSELTFVTIPTKNTLVVIRYLQFSLFKYLRTANDEVINGSLSDDEARPLKFFRGPNKRGFVIDKKLKLMDQSLELVLQACELDMIVVKYFQVLLSNRPTYFSFEVYTRNMSIIFHRVSGLPDSDLTQNLRSLCQVIDKSISNIMLRTPVRPAQQSPTVIENDKEPDVLEDLEVQPIVPNWVRYFEYQPVNFSLQNSDYSKKSTVQSSSVLPESIHEKHQNRFKQKFKAVLGIPLEPYEPKEKRRWLKRT